MTKFEKLPYFENLFKHLYIQNGLTYFSNLLHWDRKLQSIYFSDTFGVVSDQLVGILSN